MIAPPAAAARSVHHYLVFGLVLRSEMALPGLVPHPRSTADVDIRWGAVPPVEGAGNGYYIVDDATVLNVPNVTRYRIEGGDSITIAPAPEVSDRNVRLYLLGSALGAVLHQRGLIALHANAVEIAGAAVAFMGHSGAGKSTLAAWFFDRGHAVLTDDVCVVEADGAKVTAHRGLVRLRLWQDALAHSGRQAIEADRSFDKFDKFDVKMPDARAAPASLPLGAVVLLERAEEGEGFRLHRLRGAQAVDALVANIYRGGYAEIAGKGCKVVMACAGLANQVPILVVRRAWGFDRLDSEGSRIEKALAELLSGGKDAAATAAI